jgi:hypothetical protein
MVNKNEQMKDFQNDHQRIKGKDGGYIIGKNKMSAIVIQPDHQKKGKIQNVDQISGFIKLNLNRHVIRPCEQVFVKKDVIIDCQAYGDTDQRGYHESRRTR